MLNQGKLFIHTIDSGRIADSTEWRAYGRAHSEPLAVLPQAIGQAHTPKKATRMDRLWYQQM